MTESYTEFRKSSTVIQIKMSEWRIKLEEMLLPPEVAQQSEMHFHAKKYIMFSTVQNGGWLSSGSFRLRLTRKLVQVVQRRFRWFGHTAKRPEGELFKDLLQPTSPRAWRRRTGGQLKKWVTTIKTDLEFLS